MSTHPSISEVFSAVAGPDREGATLAACPTQPSPTIVINADDWAANTEATDLALQCVQHRVVSSVSAMVFMQDSHRAAELALEHDVDTGLHLNLTTEFSGSAAPPLLREHQQRIARALTSNRYSPAMFYGSLVKSFDYAVKSQLEEFERLYGIRPYRVDGHHHMHLCANVLVQQLLPRGIIVRRNFSFTVGQKSALNRAYRSIQDRVLARRHCTADYFFNLVPIDERRLRAMIELSGHANIELEVHPEKPDEYRFLMDDLHRVAPELKVARGYLLRAKPFSAAPGAAAAAEPAPAISVQAEPLPISIAAAAEPRRIPHVSVCICTYKRPEPLRRLLLDLSRQRTQGLFTFSIVIADNDENRAGEAVVEEVRPQVSVPIKYCTEPSRGIARARNKVMANAHGDYMALIDDDEFPTDDWLLNLLRACRRFDVDGVLGPVKRYFEQDPPDWLSKSSLYDRSTNPTGLQVQWREARTGNVLLKRSTLDPGVPPFRTEFRAGEDQDFFRRKIAEGKMFVWSSEAVAFEVIPPARWRRKYYVRKALLQGANAALQPSCNAVSILKSIIAVPVYTIGLPFALAAGQHRFMTLLVKLCDHAGKLLFLMKINPIREEYVSD